MFGSFDCFVAMSIVQSSLLEINGYKFQSYSFIGDLILTLNILENGLWDAD